MCPRNTRNAVSIYIYCIVISVGWVSDLLSSSMVVMMVDLVMNTLYGNDIQSSRAMKKAVLTINALCLAGESGLSLCFLRQRLKHDAVQNVPQMMHYELRERSTSISLSHSVFALQHFVWGRRVWEYVLTEYCITLNAYVTWGLPFSVRNRNTIGDIRRANEYIPSTLYVYIYLSLAWTGIYAIVKLQTPISLSQGPVLVPTACLPHLSACRGLSSGWCVWTLQG